MVSSMISGAATLVYYATRGSVSRVLTRIAARKARAEQRAATRTPRVSQDPYQRRGPRVKRRLRDMPDHKCARCVCQATRGYSTCSTCRESPGGAA